MKLIGKTVQLCPITKEEKEDFRQLVTHSDASFYWYGKEGDTRTKKEFFNSWHSDYFNIKTPMKGQCFWIEVESKRVGTINYNKVAVPEQKTDIDIFIAQSSNQEKGYGHDAIRTLLTYLFNTLPINKVWVEIRAFNTRAIHIFEKICFKKEALLRQEDYSDGKFIDCVRLGILKSEYI